MREISVDLGGDPGDGYLIRVTGCDCKVEDSVLEVVSLLKEIKKRGESQASKTVKKRPCGCGNAN